MKGKIFMKNNLLFGIYSILEIKRKNKALHYSIMKSDKELKGTIDYHKMYLSKNSKTPICMLDELLLEDVIDIRVEIYNRTDFEDIKPLLKNLDTKEYEVYQVSVNETLKLERLEFTFFKLFSIGIIIGLSILLFLK